MARPPLPLGEHGSISVTSRRGLWVARCRFRGLDGITRHIQKSGKSKTAARLALQDELRVQRGNAPRCCAPSPASAMRPTSGWARSAPAGRTRRPPTAEDVAICSHIAHDRKAATPPLTSSNALHVTELIT